MRWVNDIGLYPAKLRHASVGTSWVAQWFKVVVDFNRPLDRNDFYNLTPLNDQIKNSSSNIPTWGFSAILFRVQA